jgi:hypothetical protein
VRRSFMLLAMKKIKEWNTKPTNSRVNHRCCGAASEH